MILWGAIAGLSLFIPMVLRKWRERRTNRRLTDQLRQSLQSLVHALRVGVGFQQALDLAAKEGEEPLASEWRRILQSLRLGMALPEALALFAKRVPLRDVTAFITAVEITQATGAALADVLETLAQTLQDRQLLREKIAAATAQGKASGLVLGLLPFLLLTVLRIVAPALVRPMFATGIGQLLLATVLLLVSAGGIVIWKIVDIPAE